MIMDEPTAALGVPEQRKVLQLVRTLRDAGVPVVMITHNMQDAFEVADRLLVMRRGRLVGELQPGTTTPSDVVGLMVGVADATG
jgi:simple sugar transport system ATP-binding protein